MEWDPATEALRSASAPRWRGKAGRLEVWYATLSDPQARAGCGFTGRRSPRRGASMPTRTAGPPGFRRTGRHLAIRPRAGFAGLRTGEVRRRRRFEPRGGRARSLAWEVTWKDTGRPSTLPRPAWERELLPSAPVVPGRTPTADLAGSLSVDDAVHQMDGWRGGVAHIYGHGDASHFFVMPSLGGSVVVKRCPPSHTRPACAGSHRSRSSTSASMEPIGPQALCRSLRMRTALGVRHRPWGPPRPHGPRFVHVQEPAAGSHA